MTGLEKLVEWFKENEKFTMTSEEMSMFNSCYAKARSLLSAEREAKTPVNDMAGLWDELDGFAAGICPTELADDIRNTLEDMLYRHPKYPTAPLPKPSTDSQVEGLSEALELYMKAYPHDAPHDCFATGPMTGDYIEDLVVCPGCRAKKAADLALSRHPVNACKGEIEPLAVLADRHGFWINRISNIAGRWKIVLWAGDEERNPFIANTYAAAEQAARQYLESLNDGRME